MRASLTRIIGQSEVEKGAGSGLISPPLRIVGVSNDGVIKYYARLNLLRAQSRVLKPDMERLPEFISNHLFLVSLLVSVLMLLIWNLYGSVLSGIKQIIPAELTRLINREDAIVVDVRSDAEFGNNHILGALNIPDADFQSRQQELDKHKDKPVIFYCTSGAVSTKLARTLSSQDFENIYILKGGLPSWQNANLPLTKER